MFEKHRELVDKMHEKPDLPLNATVSNLYLKTKLTLI